MCVCCLRLTIDVDKFLRETILQVGERAEVCGLLGGMREDALRMVATTAYPLTNLSLHKNSFAIDVEELCRARNDIEQIGLMPVALYHSHPDGSTSPSYRDRQLPWITNLPSLIVANTTNGIDMECYNSVEGEVSRHRV